MSHTGFKFDNSYASLPESFYQHQPPTPVKSPRLIRVNRALAEEIGVDEEWLSSPEGVSVLAGNKLPEGATPIATAYAGHQFGMWNPQLGDGRAVLLGEVVSTKGQRLDVQLKGSGVTPYSRRGDGRAPLGPVLREYIVSEAMAALGIPTTRSLAAVSTGETVARDQMFPGAVLTRLAKSHIRIGTFEYFAARNDKDSLRALADHVIERHYPDAKLANHPYQALLEMVIDAQASLVAQWQGVGFIHGVMNTDNMLLCGETVDYGPCAFMDSYHPVSCYSAIDQHKRYAYGNQPQIAHWNLTCLAQALLPIMDKSETKALKLAQQSVDLYSQCFAKHYLKVMRRKLGLKQEAKEDQDLILDLLQRMEKANLDFTLTFRQLADKVNIKDDKKAISDDALELEKDFSPWLQAWNNRAKQETTSKQQRQNTMYNANPALIPRNHLVETAIEAALNENDFQPFHTLVNTLANPYDYNSSLAEFAKPPQPHQVVKNTFCGT